MLYRWAILLLLTPVLAGTVSAGVLFGRKKDKADPRLRVPVLVSILKMDKDADARAEAAEELREYDATVFPEIVPSLIEAMNGDPKPHVRIEAAMSLTKLRPVTQQVGEALELTVSKDASMRVRLQARSALLQYHWAGYRGKKGDVPPLNTGREPPLAADNVHPPAINTAPQNYPMPNEAPMVMVPNASNTPNGKPQPNKILPQPTPMNNQPRISPIPAKPYKEPNTPRKDPLELLPKPQNAEKDPLKNLPKPDAPKRNPLENLPNPEANGPELEI